MPRHRRARGGTLTKKYRYFLAGLCLAAVLATAGFLLLRGRSRQAPSDAAEQPIPEPGAYEAYVIGGRGASAFRPAALNDCFGCSFYNLSRENAGPAQYAELAETLVKRESLERLVLVLDLFDLTGSPAPKLNAPKSYLPDGLPDRSRENAESIGTLDTYLEDHAELFAAQAAPAVHAEVCLQAVREIRSLCAETGTALTVILTPACRQLLSGIDTAALTDAYAALAEDGPCWNFQICPLSYDERFFYDAAHLRSDAGDLLLGWMQGDPAAVPAPRGADCTAGQADTAENMLLAARSPLPTVRLPILAYHHFDDEAEESDTILHTDTFERQMLLLEQEGFHTVSPSQVLDFVDKGIPLPEKPVLITFDDGYLSNYTAAFPILRQHGMQATIFVIGCSVGHTQYYKDTTYPLTPHFGQAEIKEMTDSGLVEIQSHTYDMHQWPAYEQGDAIRRNLLPLSGESEADYLQAVAADTAQQDALFAQCGLTPGRVLAFPEGQHVLLSDVALRSCGIRATMTIDETRQNELVFGLDQSLIDMGRLMVTDETDDAALLEYLRAD